MSLLSTSGRMLVGFYVHKYKLGCIITKILKLFLVFLAIYSTHLISKTQDHLPLGTVLDSQGNPISLPSKQHSALEMSSIKLSKKTSQPSHNKKSSTVKLKKKPLTHKQFTNRSSMANDPSCRWLNSRMEQLESKITLLNDHSKNHHNQELTIRQNEWKCMKCGTKGPSQPDRDRCQYRR